MKNGLFVQRSQLVEITLPANFSGNSINVPDQPMLRNMRVTSIEFYTLGDLGVSPITGNTLATGAQMKLCSFNGYTADPVAENDMGEFLYRWPLLSMHHMQNSSGDTFVQRVNDLDDLKIQWDKCSISVSAGWTTVSTPVALLCNVFYTSQNHRHPNILAKSMKGVGDGSLVDLMIQKIMMLEDSVKRMLSNSNPKQ